VIIAICDDNEQELEQCKRQLEQLASIHQADVVFSLYHKGEELLFNLQEEKNYPDIIYLDMRMSGQQGDEVVGKLRVVAISHIRYISFKEIKLDTGEVLPVGRYYYADLKREMETYAEAETVV